MRSTEKLKEVVEQALCGREGEYILTLAEKLRIEIWYIGGLAPLTFWFYRKNMQLVSGNKGQAYNSRKNRKGVFWEDRFLPLQDYMITESQTAYNAYFSPENWTLMGKNSVFWNDFHLRTDS